MNILCGYDTSKRIYPYPDNWHVVVNPVPVRFSCVEDFNSYCASPLDRREKYCVPSLITEPIKGGCSTKINPAWVDAPYELGYIYDAPNEYYFCLDKK